MESKNPNCPCKRIKCERHGDCTACKEHHHASAKIPLATCERMKAKEERKRERNREKIRERKDK